VTREKAHYACEQLEVEGLKESEAAATDTPVTYRGLFRRDPLHDVRIVKRRARLIVYPLIALIVPVDHFLIGTPWLTTIAMTLGGGYAIATGAIEFIFFYFSKLRKEAAYPTVLAMELGAAGDLHHACEKSVQLLAELLEVEKVILALCARQGDQLATVATHGIPPEDVPLTTPQPWCQRPVKQAVEKRRVVVTSADETRTWLSTSDSRGRVAYVPLLSLDRFVGLLVLAGGRRASDLRDKTLLTTIGLAMGLTLDNLHHSTELNEVAMRDELTQLFNRRYFFEQLEKQLKAARRSGRPLGLLILDVDDLKLINDTYGHNMGDTVLANLGKLLANRVREEDIPARIGGDEFAILMPDTHERAAQATAARLEKALRTKPIYKSDGIELTLTVSCGVAGYPWSGENLAEIVLSADANMYGVKATRKGQAQPADTSAGEAHPTRRKASP
jgi:diguanylate cyclase (GGDEF)-like protein